jgi:hypothetical protein
MLAFLLIALAAIALAIAAWFRPLPSSKASAPPAPAYTDQQIASAKGNVCTAFGKVEHAVDLANAEPVSSDRTGQLAVAALSRITFEAGSRYLSTTLAEEPATPPELATAVRKESDTLQELLIGFTEEIRNTDPRQQPAVNASNELETTIRRLCK